MTRRTPPLQKAPPKPFEVGERVAYHPVNRKPSQRSIDNNVHFDAVVVGYSKAGRPRIQFDTLARAGVLRSVSARALSRQETLPL